MRNNENYYVSYKKPRNQNKASSFYYECSSFFSGRWIEPFLGTGGVAFNSESQKALLSDINPHIISFYQKLHAKEITPQHIREYLYCEGEKLEEAGDDGIDVA